MLAEGLHFDALSLVVSLNSRCVAGPGNLSMVERIHSWILENDRKLSAATGTALLKMYLKCGSVERAEKVFQEMERKDLDDSHRGTGRERLDRGSHGSFPSNAARLDPFTLVAIFQACATRLESREDDRVKALCNQAVESGLLASSSWNVIIATAVIGTYGKCGSVDKALEVLERTPRESRDVVAWNSIITVFVEQNKPELALKLLEVMERIEQGGRDLVCWNMIISALVQHSRSKEALAYFREMNLQGVKPDRVTLAPLISSATFPENESKLVLCEISRSGLSSNAVTSNAVLNFYSTRRAAGSKRRGEFSMDSKSETSYRGTR
ncbi:pentatricopeptide repeat-containing protein At1g19720-like [Selaginella moellendorffii]|uniref:pentatricopeptide repeat-containing protein At1g19720-like n=1 Tax=Selaginella moellendorffii TaxID=88036 RepID=UPI000D1C572B|nr:pentatricopeptide repeat-containing protein At1g19720-like [Selaginella moellendorffii]|eukprot:XP_024530700.1 pentatricopeptide repeat-containing protein At1g19720-like [Selaginella moellendorffii]